MEFEPHTWVAACTDLDYIYRHIEVSKEIGIKYRVLLVKTDIPMPTVEIDSELETKFLGYDYAYENDLFQTKEEIQKYISRREEYEKNMSRTHWKLEILRFLKSMKLFYRTPYLGEILLHCGSNMVLKV